MNYYLALIVVVSVLAAFVSLLVAIYIEKCKERNSNERTLAEATAAFFGAGFLAAGIMMSLYFVWWLACGLWWLLVESVKTVVGIG